MVVTRSVNRVNEENSTQKLGGCSGDSNAIPVDRISNLPESIICHILSFLPTKYAVSTSFLCKSWRHQWTNLTSFDFDDRLWPRTRRYIGLWHNEFKGFPVMDFVEFVNMVMMNNNTEFSMNKFRLALAYHVKRSVYVKVWVKTAIARNIRVLDLAVFDATTLYMEMEDQEFHLPAALYTCGTLEVLKLQGQFVIQVPHVVCLPKLAVLELIKVLYEFENSVEKLLSGCPALESFKIKKDCYRYGVKSCTISSPCLKNLDIYFSEGCSDCVSDYHFKLEIDTPELECLVLKDGVSNEICIQELRFLNEVDFDIFSSADDVDNELIDADYKDNNSIVASVEHFNHAKFLKLSEGTMNALSLANRQLSAVFERLTKLVIKLGRDSEWDRLMDLIDCCIKLEVLDITNDYIDDDWWDPIHVPKCVLSSLAKFSLRGFDGCKGEKAMLKYILKHGVVLERVDVCTTPPKCLKRSLRRKISKCRASPTCKITFI